MSYYYPEGYWGPICDAIISDSDIESRSRRALPEKDVVEEDKWPDEDGWIHPVPETEFWTHVDDFGIGKIPGGGTWASLVVLIIALYEQNAFTVSFLAFFSLIIFIPVPIVYFFHLSGLLSAANGTNLLVIP